MNDEVGAPALLVADAVWSVSLDAEPDWPQIVQRGELTALKPFVTKSLADALMSHVTAD